MKIIVLQIYLHVPLHASYDLGQRFNRTRAANEGLFRGPGDIGSLYKEDVWESFLYFVGSVRYIEDITVELGKGLRALAGKTRELCGSSEADR